MRQFYKYLHWFISSNFSKNYRRTRKEIFAISVLMVLFLMQSSILMKGRVYHLTADGHAQCSLLLAINKVACQKESMLGTGHTLLVQALMDEHWSSTPIVSLPKKILGISSEKYCESVNAHFVNNENTLMRLYASFIRILPEISLKEIGQVFDFVRIIGITCTIGVLLYIGFSPFLGIFFGLFALLMNYYLCNHIYGLYPFIPTFVFLYSILIALILYQRWYQNYTSVILSGALLGGGGALFFNLRTSYFPFIIVGFIIFLIAMYTDAIQQKIKTNRAIIIVIISFITFTASFYYSHSNISVSKPMNSHNYAYHAVAHPLVLALGVPENNLSRREGIVWNDGVGLSLAQRVDPEATYLGPSYEKALFIYYINLWKQYPKEMFNLYFQKWWIALHNAYAVIFNDTQINVIENAKSSLVNYFFNKVYRPIYLYTPGKTCGHINGVILICLTSAVFLYSVFKRNFLYMPHLLAILFLLQYPLLGKLNLGGMMYTGLLVGTMALAITKMHQWNVAVIAFIAIVNMAAFLIMLEATIIMPWFLLTYHSTGES